MSNWYRTQYAGQRSTNQVYKRTLIKLTETGNDAIDYQPAPTGGAWRPVGVTEDHPWSGNPPADPYMASLQRKAERANDIELGQIYLTQTAPYQQEANTRAIDITSIRYNRSVLPSTSYLVTHGAQVSDRPIETQVAADMEAVQVLDTGSQSATSDGKSIVSEMGLTASQKKKGKVVLFILAGLGIIYLGYQLFTSKSAA